VIIAVAKYDRNGFVGDPWVYNEYIDNRKLLPQIENYKAAEDL
jgi:unsaturated rhamnogalacturonyl hydrolase